MDSPQAGLTALGKRVQAALEAETRPDEQIRAARAGLLERVSGGARRGSRARAGLRWSIGVAAACVLGLGVAFWLRSVRTADAPLSFETSLGARQRRLEIEHALHARAIGEHRRRLAAAKQRA